RLSRKRTVKESLEDLDLRQSIEYRLDAVPIHGRKKPTGLRGVPQPLALFRHKYLGVVETDRRTVDASKLFDRFVRIARRLGSGAVNERRRQRAQVVLGETVCRRRQRRVSDWFGPEGIDPRREMPVTAEALGEVCDANNLPDVRRGGRRRCRYRLVDRRR